MGKDIQYPKIIDFIIRRLYRSTIVNINSKIARRNTNIEFLKFANVCGPCVDSTYSTNELLDKFDILNSFIKNKN